MELAGHTGERAVNDANHLAGLGFGILLTHEVGVVEIGVAKGTELFHLLVRNLVQGRRTFLAGNVPRERTLGKGVEQAALTAVLLQEKEVVDHGQQDPMGTPLTVGLLGVHHGNEVRATVLGEKLAELQFLTVECTEDVPDGGGHEGIEN